MKTKSGLLLALFSILLITSIITLLYGLGSLIVYIIVSKMDNTEKQKREYKLKFALSISFGLVGIILFSVLLTHLYK
jgi:hypothetical protein